MRLSKFGISTLAPFIIAVMASDSATADQSRLPGPIEARIERVVDGDTVKVRAWIWLGQEIRVTVRLNGVDTPEMKGRCTAEKKLAASAKHFTSQMLKTGRITLRHIRLGKYAGRIVADIANGQGRDLGKALIRAGLGRSYRGMKRRPWCSASEKAEFDKTGKAS